MRPFVVLAPKPRQILFREYKCVCNRKWRLIEVHVLPFQGVVFRNFASILIIVEP